MDQLQTAQQLHACHIPTGGKWTWILNNCNHDSLTQDFGGLREIQLKECHKTSCLPYPKANINQCDPGTRFSLLGDRNMGKWTCLLGHAMQPQPVFGTLTFYIPDLFVHTPQLSSHKNAIKSQLWPQYKIRSYSLLPVYKCSYLMCNSI